MTREDIQQSITKINQAIAQLDAQLHPPPLDSDKIDELEAELNQAMAARTNLEEALANLPVPTPDPTFGITAAKAIAIREKHSTAEATAAISVSKTARKRATSLLAVMPAPAKAAAKRSGGNKG